MVKSPEVTCSKCGITFIPDLAFDVYPDPNDSTKEICERCMMRDMFAQPARQPEPLSKSVIETLCQPGTEVTCGYMMLGSKGEFCCAKGTTFESALRHRIANGSMKAHGDNCSGPPDFTPTAVINTKIQPPLGQLT